MFKQLIAVTPEDAKKIRVRCLDRQRWVLLHSSLGIVAEGDKFREIFDLWRALLVVPEKKVKKKRRIKDDDKIMDEG
jgi:hypothetical protein